MDSPSYRAGAVAGFALAVALMAGSVVYFVSSGGSKAACSAEVAEAIDPSSSQHLLPGTPDPQYADYPPTSGAHRPGTYKTGALRDTIDDGVQVNMLEAGDVLIQYRNQNVADRRAIEKLAEAPHVTTAPNPKLTTNIVATAWLHRMECSRVDSDDLQRFIDAHVQKVRSH